MQELILQRQQHHYFIYSLGFLHEDSIKQQET